MSAAMRPGKSLSANAAWSLFVGLGWPTVLMLATTRIYLRYLGVRQYAVFAVATAIVMVAGTLRLGATEATVKYVAHYRAEGDSRRLGAVVGATLLIYSGAALVGSACIYLGAPLLAERVLGLSGAEALDAIAAIRVTALGFPANLLVSAASSVFAGFERYDKATLLSSGLATAGAFAGIAALVAGAGLRGLFKATVAVTWVIALAAMAFAWKWSGLQLVRWREYVTALRSVLGFGVFSSVNALAYTAFNTVDRLIVGAVLGAEAVAHYAVSASVASRIYTVAIAATQALLPRISALRAAGESREAEGRAFYSALAIVVAFGAAAAAGLSGASHGILHVWLGPEFAEKATPALAIQSWTFALLATSVVPYYFLNAIGRPQVATYWFAVGALVQYPAMYLLGRAWGMYGVLISTLVFPVVLLGMLRAAMRQVGASEGLARETGWLARSAGVTGVAAGGAGLVAGTVGMRLGSGVLGLACSLATIIVVVAPSAYRINKRRLETLSGVTARVQQLRLRLVKWGFLRA